MIALDDIEIKIKKYDREKNNVIINLVIFEQLEIRGFRCNYMKTKYSNGNSVWIVNPPSIKGRNKTWFHIIRFKDSDLWQELEKRIIEDAKEYTNI